MENKESIGFKVGRLVKAYGEYTYQSAVKTDLPKGSLRLFPYLDIHRDEDVTQKDLCKHTRCKASTISVLIDDLETDGYLKKSKSKQDSRKTVIKLTEKGTKAAHQVKKILDDTDELLEKSLTREEQEVFLSCLDKLSNILKGGQ